MAKLTKAQRSDIISALSHARAVRDYVMNPDVAVARRRQVATTTLDYTRADGNVLYEVRKDFGSDLSRINDVIGTLQRLLVA